MMCFVVVPKALKSSINTLTRQLIDSQAESKALARKSSDQKEIINKLENGNKQLRQENEMIVCDRARLEGQIAHMEKMV